MTRAGRGWSDPSDTAQDGAQMMTDLHTLLHRGGVPGPYVSWPATRLVACMYASFAADYPDEVAGMVLIDSTSDSLPASMSAQGWGPDDILARASVLASTSARLGVGRLLGLGYGSLPPRSDSRGARKARHLKQPSQHHRRVHASQCISSRGCNARRLR